jgi:predicted PhzF superfamily epimerase YddE/YHI9
MMQLQPYTLPLLLLLVSIPAVSDDKPRAYPRPVEPLYEEGDGQLTCRQLEQQLSQLESRSYTAKPGFYEDPYTGASIWIGSLWVPGALSYLGYSAIAEYQENDRLHHIQSRIEALRRMKANLRCYE